MTWQQYEADLEDRPRGPASRGSTGERTGRSRRDGCTSRKRTGGNGRWASRRWRTRSSSRPWSTVLNADLRGGLPGLLLWVPARAQPARCAGRALRSGLMRKKVNWVLDADIRGFFDTIDHEWLVKFVEHRIADRRILRLIQKWLKAGVSRGRAVVEDGARDAARSGGFAAARERVPALRLRPVGPAVAEAAMPRGDVIVVRYADDFVLGFQHASRRRAVPGRLCGSGCEQFGLELHPEKTRLIEFGRFAAQNRRAARRRETGDLRLPGLHAHLREASRARTFLLKRKTIEEADAGQAASDPGRAASRRRHRPIGRQGDGWDAWCAGTSRTTPSRRTSPHWDRSGLRSVRHWHRALRRRSQTSIV